MKYKPKCVKCGEKYESDEPDDFYCPPCEKIKTEIAKEVDVKLAGRPPKRKVESELKKYDSINGGKWVNARDLGI